MLGRRDILRGASGIVAANIGARVAALVSLSLATLMIARIGGPTAVGIYALLRVLPSLVGVLAAAGLPGAIAYFLAGPFHDDRRLPSTICATAIAGGTAGALFWWGVLTPLAGGRLFPGVSTALVALAGATVLTQLFVATAKSLRPGQRRPAWRERCHRQRGADVSPGVRLAVGHRFSR